MKQIWNIIKGPLTSGILLGTKVGTELAIQFLKDIRISTREWIVEGDKGGDEGGGD
jgi:hypothetical protein